MMKREKSSKPQSDREQTQPAEEWGERLATGRAIARGGKTAGAVPGAEESPHGMRRRRDPSEDQKKQAVADALARLGADADPGRIVQAVRVQAGIELDPSEAWTLRRALDAERRPVFRGGHRYT